MMLYNESREVVFTWGRNQPLHGFASQQGWNFPSDASMRVTLTFGTQPLPDRTALGRGEAVLFMVDQPIDDLLLSSGSIGVNPGTTATTIALPPASRMASLVSAAQRCRQALSLPPS